MSTAEELLASVVELSNDVLTIDSNLRTISIPKGMTCLGVEADDGVQKLKFSMPRTYNGIDLSTYNVRINYENARKEGDIYSPTDVKVSEDAITFTWVVGRLAFNYIGNVRFNVCLKLIGDDAVILSEFNTTWATLPVLEGLEVEEAVVEEVGTDALASAAYEAIEKALSTELKGDAPVKGVDYFTEEEKDEFVADIIDGYNSKVANSFIGKVEGEIIRADDVNPLKHDVDVAVRSQNLVKYPFANGDKTVVGVTFTVDEATQKVTINGTATSNTSFAYGYGNSTSFKVKAGEVYTMTCESSLTDGRGYVYLQVMEGSTTYQSLSIMQGSKTFTATHDGYVAIGLVVVAGITYNNEVVAFQVEKGDTYTGFKPYVDPSTVTVTGCGKNMIPIHYSDGNIKRQGVTYTYDSKGVITATGTSSGSYYTLVTVAEQKLYLTKGLSYAFRANSDAVVSNLAYAYVKDAAGINYFDRGSGCVFTPSVSGYGAVTLVIQTNMTVTNATFKLQLEVGDEHTDYESPSEYSTVTAESDGICMIKASHPNMTLFANAPGVIIEAEYGKDTNSVMGDISTALDTILAMQEELLGGEL